VSVFGKFADSVDLGSLKSAKKGQIIPIVKTVSVEINPVEFFSKLSDYGRKENCILLESADIVPKYGVQSIGSATLNKTGENFLAFLKGKFDFCDEILYGKKEIKGKLAPKHESVSEEQRLKQKTHMDVLRAIAFALKPVEKPIVPFAGLFGCISYDFIDQFEALPKNKTFLTDVPDYEMFFLDNLFTYDHKKQQLVFVANALLFNGEKEKIAEECVKKITAFEKALSKPLPKPRELKFKELKKTTDTGKKEFLKIVEKFKKHVSKGDVFQAVPSRTIISEYNSEPLDIYRELKQLNPSPYMFYFKSNSFTLLGSSPEMFLRVQGPARKKVEIRPIAGTKPRGIINGRIDKDLDSRFEAELKIDSKEMAEHTMLIDLARNDVARVCIAGSRHVDEPFVVEKYSHVQHLVSNVSGTLKPGLDALHAYLASMNMGTLTGAPKVKAMELLRKYEKNKRGLYGGSIGYLTPAGDFDSAIVIRSIQLHGKKAFVRAGAGVVFDSIPEREFEETQRKAAACLKAIELANEKNNEAIK